MLQVMKFVVCTSSLSSTYLQLYLVRVLDALATKTPRQRACAMKSCSSRFHFAIPTSRRPIHIGWSDVTESVVATRPPFCGYNTIQCVELNGENISCYSNKIESVIWRKCSYDHWLTKKAYLSAITVTNISRSFTYKMTTKVNWQSPYEYDTGFPAM